MNSINVALSRRTRHERRPPGSLLRRIAATGFEDAAPLTTQALEGEHPRGRELSMAWLAGTVMTGLTSVLLMGAALYVSFKGQENFSTASEAMLFQKPPSLSSARSTEKGDRPRSVAQTRSDIEVIAASTRELVEGRTMIRSQEFVRVDATLATSATPLAENIPAFDASSLLATLPDPSTSASPEPRTEIYSTSVEGEVAISISPLSTTYTPAAAINDFEAGEFAKVALQDVFADDTSTGTFAYAAQPASLSGLAIDAAPVGIAENVTVVPKTVPATEGGGRSERIVTVSQPSSLEEQLLKNGFTPAAYRMVEDTLGNVLPSSSLPAGAKLRILMGPSRSSPVPVPYRLSIYFHDPRTKAIKHAATAALTDRGGYVIGLEPGAIEFPDEDFEAVDVNSLPSLYRAIWETARKLDIDDDTTSQLVALFAYEVELTQKVIPGDSIRLLMSQPETGKRELLYAALTTGSTTRELFRFQSEDGRSDFYSPDGETGKRFLTRRPLQGGGRLASRYGYRVHPIFKNRRLHSGVDLASPLGTPVYAGGDGVVKRAQWVSGYGRYVELDHVNGYQTAYAHMSRIADGLTPGDRVRQGQVVGYVGSTGNSTGNHLHYEIRVNGRTVDPLSVKLPRDKELPAQSEPAFAQTTAQIRALMDRNPLEVAAR